MNLWPLVSGTADAFCSPTRARDTFDEGEMTRGLLRPVDGGDATKERGWGARLW